MTAYGVILDKKHVRDITISAIYYYLLLMKDNRFYLHNVTTQISANTSKVISEHQCLTLRPSG